MNNTKQKTGRRPPGPKPFGAGRVTFVITEDQGRDLNAYCERHDKRRSDVLREAISRFLAEDMRGRAA